MRTVTLQNVTRSVRAQPRTTTITPHLYQTTISRFANSPVLQRNYAPRTLYTSSSRLSTKPVMAPAKIDLKTAKGTRDWDGEGIILREQIFETSQCPHHKNEAIVFFRLLSPPLPRKPHLLTLCCHSQKSLQGPRRCYDRYTSLRA